MNLHIDITQHFHLRDGSHGFAGEIYYDQDQLICEFLNPGNNRRWLYQWAEGSSFIRFAGEAIKKYPTRNSQDLSDSIKQFIIDLMVAQEKELANA
jgi:hypothetical protein